MSRSKISLSVYNLLSDFTHKIFPNNKIKLRMEYFFWWWTKRKEKEFGNWHYQEFFTKYFKLDKSFYTNKSILDIGCGPRGSLEWAKESRTYAIDPLIEKYKKLGLDNHQTTYVQANCESIPFDNNFFDIVSSFNSLDHVDDLQESVSEIKRVLKPQGTFLLIADIHDHKTICEPSAFSWDIIEKFTPEFKLVFQQHYEGDNMYKSIRKGVKYDHHDANVRYGIIMARFVKQ